MTAKRVSRPKGSGQTGAPSAAPELSTEAVVTILESTSIGVSPADIDPQWRQQLIAAEAYAIAERRGFVAGRELDDWVAAESAVDAMLQKTHAS